MMALAWVENYSLQTKTNFVKVVVNLELFMKKHFWKKSLTMPKKTEREDPLEFFNIHSVAKLQKMKGDPMVKKNLKKVAQCRKNLWSRPVLYVTRETFLVQFLGPTGTIWRLLKIL